MSNNSFQDNIKSKLEEMEAKLNEKMGNENPVYDVRPHVEPDSSLVAKIYSWLSVGRNWFQQLPTLGKVGVGIGSIWLSLSIIGAIFHVVGTILNIGILALVVFGFYKLFLAPSDSNKS